MDERDLLIKQQQVKIEHLSSELKKNQIDLDNLTYQCMELDVELKSSRSNYENALYDWNQLNVKLKKLKDAFKILLD